jgi:hypothetical protein
MLTISEWLTLRAQLEQQRAEWDAGLVQIRLSDGRMMYLDDAVPDTRADCPTQKPCPHVRCRHHLWRVDIESRAGRPGLSSVPRDAQGRTLKVEGCAGTERPGTTLEARWLETPVPPSCALDESSRGPLSNEEVGDRYVRHRTLAARDINRALAKAIEVAEGMGMSSEDLLRGLRELGGGG